MICPKCMHVSIGNTPIYVKDISGEYLQERCSKCGFTQKKPCADASGELVIQSDLEDEEEEV